MPGCQKNFETALSAKQKQYINFFETPKQIDGKTKNLITVLKRYDSTSHFISKLPGNLGTPIWNKVFFNKTKNIAYKSADDSTGTTAVAIALSEDNEFLSGVILLELQNDTVTSLKPFDDAYFHRVSHGTTFDLDKAKEALGLFLLMDYKVFGAMEFEKIPRTLFPDKVFNNADNNTTRVVLDTSEYENGDPSGLLGCFEISWYLVDCTTPSADNCSNGCDATQPGGCCCGACSVIGSVSIMICSGGGGGNSGGDNGGNGGSDGSGNGGSGSGGGGGGYGDGYHPPTCGGRWYREQPCNGSGSGNNNEIDENGFYYTKIDTLKANILLNPFALIPCDSLNLMPLLQYGSMFQQVAQYQVPQSILTRLDSIRQAQGAWSIDNYNIQALTNADGPVVNCDFFPIKITQLPFKSNGVQMTSKELLEYFRLNINDFIKPPVYVSFNPSGSPYFTDYAHWNLPYQDALGSVVHIHIPGPLGTSNDGSVLLSDYSNINSTYQHNYFKFSTLETPFDYEHPVAGNREFGIYNSSANPNQFTFYTMGVDRTWDWQTHVANILFDGFKKGDELWDNVQNNLKLFINQNSGQASFYTPKAPKARPDYNAIRDYLEGKISKDSLSIKLGCI